MTWRIIIYRSPDPGEMDFKYLAVAIARGAEVVASGAGCTEEAARKRLDEAVKAWMLS